MNCEFGPGNSNPMTYLSGCILRQRVSQQLRGQCVTETATVGVETCFQSGYRILPIPIAAVAVVRGVAGMMRDGEGESCQDALNKWRLTRNVTQLNVLLEASFVP